MKHTRGVRGLFVGENVSCCANNWHGCPRLSRSLASRLIARYQSLRGRSVAFTKSSETKTAENENIVSQIGGARCADALRAACVYRNKQKD